MIEPIMFFGIGFLVASLIGLVIIPLVHTRAVQRRTLLDFFLPPPPRRRLASARLMTANVPDPYPPRKTCWADDARP